MKRLLMFSVAMLFLLVLSVGYGLCAAKQTGANISGKVVETMDSGGYTYVCVEKSKKKTWVAVPQTKVAVGKNMSFYPGMEMKNFTSKTLNRTFDSIIFSSGPVKK